MLNKVGKTLTIFIILTFILLVSSTCIGFFLYHQEEHSHKRVQSDLDSLRANNEKLQAQLKDVQGQLALAVDKNKEADQKINSLLDEKDLNEGLRTALKKENVQLKEQVANVEASRQKIKADLADSISKLSQFKQLLKAAQDKSRELESRLSGLTDAENRTELRIDEPNAAEPSPSSAGHNGNDKVELGKIVVNPKDAGHILTVDTDAEFVVFNLGLKQGIKTDALLSVYRGDQYLGDIKATRVQDEMSAADIIPPLSSRSIHKNDSVVLKP